jgi:hypothetical protein
MYWERCVKGTAFAWMIEENHEKFQLRDSISISIQTKQPPSPRIQVSTITARVITDYGIYSQGIGVRFPGGARDMFPTPRPAVGSTQPLIQWVFEALSSVVKQSGREADLHLVSMWNFMLHMLGERGCVSISCCFVVTRKYFHTIFIRWWETETGFLFHNVWRIVHKVDGVYLHPPIRLRDA